MNADGIVLMTNADGVYMGDPSLEPLMGFLNAHSAVVFLNPGALPAEVRMFGPAGTFDPDPEVADEDYQIGSIIAALRDQGGDRWPNRIQSVASAIKVPVNFSLSELDALWESSPYKINQASAMFTQSPLVEARVQRFAGHSVYLHRVARAYNLRTIAFVDDCLNAPRKAQ